MQSQRIRYLHVYLTDPGGRHARLRPEPGWLLGPRPTGPRMRICHSAPLQRTLGAVAGQRSTPTRAGAPGGVRVRPGTRQARNWPRLSLQERKEKEVLGAL